MSARLPAFAADITALLAERGAPLVEVPVLQPANPFLDMAGEADMGLRGSEDALGFQGPVIDPGLRSGLCQKPVGIARPVRPPDIHVALGLDGLQRKLVLFQTGIVVALAGFRNRLRYVLPLVPISFLGRREPRLRMGVQGAHGEEDMGMGLLIPV